MKDDVLKLYVSDILAEVLFHQASPMRVEELVTSLPEGLNVTVFAAEKILSGDNRFSATGPRWDLAYRKTDAGRPLGGLLDAILTAYGRPMPRTILIAELVLLGKGTPDTVSLLLQRLTGTGKQLLAAGELVYLSDWLFKRSSGELEGRLFINKLTDDGEFVAIRPKLVKSESKKRTPADTAAAVLKSAGIPLHNRALGLVLDELLGDRFDPADLMEAMCRDAERFLCLNGPRWVEGRRRTEFQQQLAKTRKVKKQVAETPDIVEVLSRSTTVRYKFKNDEVAQILRVLQASRLPMGIDELLADVLQIEPDQRNYANAAKSIEELLDNDMSLLRVARGYYIPRAAIPQWVYALPRPLKPEETAALPRERSPDVVLSLEEIEKDLVERVTDPFYEDVGDKHIVITEQPDTETTLPVLYHHRQCGTAPYRICDRLLFDSSEGVSVVTFVTTEGERMPVWINREIGLLYGLLSWYESNLPASGALMTVRRRPGEHRTYDVIYDGTNDAATYIGRERLEQVLALQKRLQRRRVFLYDVVRELLLMAEKGLIFDQLWAQLNIIRRTTRLQLASILSYYPHFKISEGARWHYTAD